MHECLISQVFSTAVKRSNIKMMVFFKVHIKSNESALHSLLEVDVSDILPMHIP